MNKQQKFEKDIEKFLKENFETYEHKTINYVEEKGYTIQEGVYIIKTSNSGYGTTGRFTLQTEALGSGTPITIQPNYITLKFWKRLS